jgi:cell division protein FtsI/penicillin-binding protein 2
MSPMMSSVRLSGLRHVLLSCLGLALLVSVATACSGSKSDGSAPATTAARGFLQSWSSGNFAQAGGMTDNSTAAAAGLQSAKTALNAAKVTFEAGKAQVDGTAAKVGFTAHWTIAGVARQWSYPGSLAMTKPKTGDWRVHWAPTVINPGFRAGQRLSAIRTLPDRAALLDDHGKPLFNKVQVVTVGIEPKFVHNIASLSATLARVLQVSAADIVTSVKAAKPTEFVPVITLRQPDYQKVRSKIHDLPGTVFQTGVRELGPTSQFAKLLLGSVGPATAEVLKSLGPGYLPTDEVGTSGMQAAYNKQLTGTAGVTITATATKAAPGAAEPGGSSDSRKTTTLGRIPAVPGKSLRTTLDVATQNAADAALAKVKKQASIVAIQPSTGAILAVANSPSTTYDIAMQGQYPAGSTFKIITSAALLENHRVAAGVTVPCPGTTTVYGKVFHNENSFDLGNVPLQTAFAHSCNTSFTGLSTRLAGTDLPRAAKQFGIGAAWSLPVTSYSGSVPAPKDAAERAADSIGQGRVLVSPFAMALVAATVPHGSTPAPSLIAGQPAHAAHAPTKPPASTLQTLKSFMRAVVTDGTAKGLASVPGGPVAGKTGTAEYGTAKPPHSHAWFAGYQGDLAFSTFIEGGESSSTTAVPISAAFLRALHH